MRKFASLFVTAILCSMLVFAQNRTISGTVTDANGKPVPFASITVKGANTGVNADADGKFTMKNVPSGSTLVISSVGFDTKEVSVGTSDVLSITITPTAGSMSEVVVTTAFGIKKSARVTPFSAQTLNEQQLKVIPQSNINNALAGKVAGTQFRGQSAIKLDAQGAFRVRGGQGLEDNGPVYVVDGTIVNSFDINPDDVEDVTFLKGVNATTLFGGQAGNGAVVITTKKRGLAGSAGIEFSQGITFDKAYILPKYQNIYGGGADKDFTLYTWQAGQPTEWQALSGKYYHDYTDDASWGPRMVGQEYIPWYAWYPGSPYSYQTTKLVAQPDNARDFWQTGLTLNNNISFGKNGQGYNFRASYTDQYIKGLLPNSSSRRNTMFFTGSVDLNSHFTFAVNGTYSYNVIKGEFVDGYANQSSGSFNQWFHRDLDMGKIKELKNLRSPFGTLATWNLRFNPDGYNPNAPENFYKANYWYNYYSYFDNIWDRSDRHRFWGDASLIYKLNNNIRLKGTVRKNQLTTRYENITTSLLEQSALQTGVLGAYSTGESNLQRYDYELVGSYSKTFGDFGVSANAGGNIFTYEYNDLTSNTNQGLNVPGLYSISNSKANPTIGNTRQRQKVYSAFVQGDIEWKKMISATFAVREDWSSTLSQSKPHLLYPSAGASFIFSEVIKNRPSWFSYGKLFGSWGKKPESLGIFATNFTYGVNQFLWGSNFLMGTPDANVDPNIQGALISTVEAGFDLRFLKNRLGWNLTYYHEVADRIPLNVPVNPVSGFTSTQVNAAKVERTGIEMVVSGKPIMSKDFTWDVSATFGYLISNPVKELYGDQKSILLQGGSFGTRFARAFQVKGEDWGQLMGGGMMRDSATGLPLVNPATGLYITDPNKRWGSIVPKVTGGLLNSFNYKNFDLSFSLDYQVGGHFFSLSEMWGSYSGLLDWTAARNDKGVNVRTPVGDDGGVHVVGISSVDKKTPVDMYVEAQPYFHGFYDQQIAEPFVHSMTFVKLREVALGYRIPLAKIGSLSRYFQSAQFSVVARNPWLIYSDSKNFDPSEVVSNFGEDGQFPGTRSLGVNLKLNF